MQERKRAAGVTASAMSEVSTLKTTDDIFLTQMVEEPNGERCAADLGEQRGATWRYEDWRQP